MLLSNSLSLCDRKPQKPSNLFVGNRWANHQEVEHAPVIGVPRGLFAVRAFAFVLREPRAHTVDMEYMTTPESTNGMFLQHTFQADSTIASVFGAMVRHGYGAECKVNTDKA